MVRNPSLTEQKRKNLKNSLKKATVYQNDIAEAPINKIYQNQKRKKQQTSERGFSKGFITIYSMYNKGSKLNRILYVRKKAFIQKVANGSKNQRKMFSKKTCGEKEEN
ncbi:hypothetical protein AVEN_242708-1 [Araneus ventricosus]|uniref:Uncharacterized protein n=1 Tax=Araneus ventricosus TaxID=182803 RepID=A0A4Y2DZ64_ARAVE|nr:hypothetical protein AVEN_242708-1 [Araneus ventricosus]